MSRRDVVPGLVRPDTREGLTVFHDMGPTCLLNSYLCACVCLCLTISLSSIHLSSSIAYSIIETCASNTTKLSQVHEYTLESLIPLLQCLLCFLYFFFSLYFSKLHLSSLDCILILCTPTSLSLSELSQHLPPCCTYCYFMCPSPPLVYEHLGLMLSRYLLSMLSN